ncbi:MAG: hypothetical protein WED81_04575 [Rhodothermales bacterium]
MADETNRADLENELSLRKHAIKQRLDTLQGEISTAPAAIRSKITKNPWLGVAAVTGAGLLVGLMLARLRRKAHTAPAHQQLVEQYIAAVGSEVQRRVKRGKDPAEAVRSALEHRVPIIVYTPGREDREEKRGFVGQAGDLALKTALGFVIKTAIDLFSASFSVEKLQALLELEEERQQEQAAATPPSGDGAHRMDRGSPSMPQSE